VPNKPFCCLARRNLGYSLLESEFGGLLTLFPLFVSSFSFQDILPHTVFFWPGVPHFFIPPSLAQIVKDHVCKRMVIHSICGGSCVCFPPPSLFFLFSLFPYLVDLHVFFCPPTREKRSLSGPALFSKTFPQNRPFLTFFFLHSPFPLFLYPNTQHVKAPPTQEECLLVDPPPPARVPFLYFHCSFFFLFLNFLSDLFPLFTLISYPHFFDLFLYPCVLIDSQLPRKLTEPFVEFDSSDLFITGLPRAFGNF